MAVTFLTNEDKQELLNKIEEASGGCITGSGAPTNATVGKVGAFYMDTDTDDVYKCTAVEDESYTWKLCGEELWDEISNLNKEIGDNQAEIEKILGVEKITDWVDGYYINTEGTTVDLNAPIKSSAWQYAVVECQGGDIFDISGTGQSGARLWAFADNENNILSAAKVNAVENQLVLSATLNAAKLIINTKDKNVSCYKMLKSYVTATDAVAVVDISETLIKGGYINLSGKVGNTVSFTPSASSSYAYLIKECRKNDIFIVTATGSTSARAYAFTDSDSVMLDRQLAHLSDSSFAIENKILIAPADGYFIANARISAGYELRHINNGCYILDSIKEDHAYTTDRMRHYMRRNYNIGYANAYEPLQLVNVYGNTQNVHPSVVRVPSGLDYKYWMAYTPYPNSQVDKENPCIAYSSDGIEWANIAGNPLDTPTEEGCYFSDTQLVWRSDLKRLECYYRLANGSDDTTIRGETIYRRTSSDGKTWSDKEVIVSATGGLSNYLSPSIRYDADNSRYQMWTVVNSNGYKIRYFESTDNTGTSYTMVRDIELTYEYGGGNHNAWHLDVQYMDGKYVAVVMTKNPNVSKDWMLFITESADNITYSKPVALMTGDKTSWDGRMYRSCLCKVADDDYRLYYSAVNYASATYGIGISLAKKPWDFVGLF